MLVLHDPSPSPGAADSPLQIRSILVLIFLFRLKALKMVTGPVPFAAATVIGAGTLMASPYQLMDHLNSGSELSQTVVAHVEYLVPAELQFRKQ